MPLSIYLMHTVGTCTCRAMFVAMSTSVFLSTCMMFEIVNGLVPPYITQVFTSNNTVNNYALRSSIPTFKNVAPIISRIA